MKKKGLYIILSLYCTTRWLTEWFANNLNWFDANILYFVFDGLIICCIAFFLYGSSNKDYISKLSLFVMLSLGIMQCISFVYSMFYCQYIYYLPVIIAFLTALEIYKKYKPVST